MKFSLQKHLRFSPEIHALKLGVAELSEKPKGQENERQVRFVNL